MKIPAVLLVILALVIGIVPLVYNCQAEGQALTLANGRTVPMKCFWTAMAELAIAAPLVVTGALLAFSRRKETHINLSVMGGLLGACALVVPTALIGVCANPAHNCNKIMLPTLLLAGTLVVGTSLVTLFTSWRRVEVAAG